MVSLLPMLKSNRSPRWTPKTQHSPIRGIYPCKRVSPLIYWPRPQPPTVIWPRLQKKSLFQRSMATTITIIIPKRQAKRKLGRIREGITKSRLASNMKIYHKRIIRWAPLQHHKIINRYLTIRQPSNSPSTAVDPLEVVAKLVSTSFHRALAQIVSIEAVET